MPTIPVPVIGPSNRARSLAQQSGRTVNLYPEVNDPDAASVVALIGAPGYQRVADFEDDFGPYGRIRGMHVMAGRLFVVVGAKVSELSLNTERSIVRTELATLATTSGRVGISSNAGKLIIGDGVAFVVLDPDTLVLTTILNEGEEPIAGWFSVLVDGYTLYFEKDSGRYHYSAINDPLTVEGLNYVSAEGSPDNTVAALTINREVICLGTDTIEYHADTGGSDNAFGRIAGGFREWGCDARWSACVIGSSVVFVGGNAQGRGRVLACGGAGSDPTPISSAAVEKAIGRVLFSGANRANLTEQITGYADSIDGQDRYVLNLPAVPASGPVMAQRSQTWAYYLNSKTWVELATLHPSESWQRLRADMHAIWKGRHLYGSHEGPHVLESHYDYFSDDDRPWVRFRETAHMTFPGRVSATLDELTLQMEVGVGLDGGVLGSDPMVMLYVSHDGGRTWGEEIPRSIGRIGEYQTEVKFHSLGMSKDFVFRVSVSDPVKVVLLGGSAKVRLGR